MGERLDSLGMFAAAEALPDQMESALTAADGLDNLPDPATLTNVLVLGMGGSGIVGDILPVAAGPFMPLPVVVVKNYEPPSYVNENTLVFAVSFSGNTEETVQAASTAAALGGRMVVISSGGRLAELAPSWGGTHIPVDDTIPMPRAGLGAMTVPPLVVLEDLGLFPGAREWTARAIEQLRVRRDELKVAGSAAEDVAARIGKTIPLIYGGGGLGMVAARRWKCEMNENPEVPAFSADLPEANHNELNGWTSLADMTSTRFTSVYLRHDHEHPQVMAAYPLLTDAMGSAVADTIEIEAAGDGPVAQMFDLMYQGTQVSLQMAVQAGVDPGPINVLTAMKQALAG